MFNMALHIENWATKHVQDRTRQASKAHSDALVSSGFRLRQLTQVGMRQQAPGDVTWPAVHPWAQRGGLAKAKRAFARRQVKSGAWGKSGRISVNKTPLSRLAGAVRYEKQVQSGPDGSISKTTVRMGFLKSSVARLAAYHADAHTVEVTPKMRRFIFAAGFGIRKSTIAIPARPHVGAVYRKNHSRISEFVQKRINVAWAGGDPKGTPPTF
jgi:hypothetical protein